MAAFDQGEFGMRNELLDPSGSLASAYLIVFAAYQKRRHGDRLQLGPGDARRAAKACAAQERPR